MGRMWVLVVVLVVFGTVGLGASTLLPQPAVAQSTTPSGLCDTTAVEQFTDVSASEYGADYMLCMRALGLSQGVGGGGYGPDRDLNRAQMASFLVRLWRDVLGNECPTAVVSPFTDIAADSAHADNIDCLYGLGITTGTTATTYGPQDPLKASQITRFLYRTYQKTGDTACSTETGSELEQATACLLQLHLIPNSAEATAATPVTRAQMGVYLIGLWHNLTGRGLPPTPPQLPTETESTTTTRAGEQSTPRIAYTVRVVGIGMMNADGTNKQRLTDFGSEPVWSPDGTMISYGTYGLEGHAIRAMSADGSDQRIVALSPRRSLGRESWTPDGTRFIYFLYNGASYDLWVMNVDGTNKVRLVESVDGASLSPDGKSIAYVNRTEELWVVNVDGTEKLRLATEAMKRRDPAWSPDGTRIVYGSTSTYTSQGLRVVNADGTNPKRLTTGDSSYDFGNPSWSPDGKSIAYVNDGLSVINADGTNRRRIDAGRHTRISYNSTPRWSPDGTRIAYTQQNRSGIWVIDADGTNPRRVADNAYGPRWSPDGTRIAYSLWRTDIWLSNSDGSDRRGLAEDGDSPSWSPDGKRIAYVDGLGGLWVINADGTNRRRIGAGLHSDSIFASTPSWSPDGTRIMYTLAGRGANDTWLSDSDGSGRQRLAGHYQVWSPDGTRIAYLAFDGSGLWVMNVDGTNPRRVADNAYDPVWSPDGKSIAYWEPESRTAVWSSDNSYHWEYTGGVWVISPDGTSTNAGSPDGRGPVWSPDGTRIAYLADGGLWVMNVDGTNPRRVADYAFSPVWSPDGTRIAYDESSTVGGGVWAVRVDGTHQMFLVRGGVQPRWSPDGTRIAYRGAGVDAYTGIWLMNADGTDPVQLTTNVGSWPEAVWSPAG